MVVSLHRSRRRRRRSPLTSRGGGGFTPAKFTARAVPLTFSRRQDTGTLPSSPSGAVLLRRCHHVATTCRVRNGAYGDDHLIFQAFHFWCTNLPDFSRYTYIHVTSNEVDV
ncbi:hypothetical protein PUN28_001924 [Cardiocondyla obscurior]|uniref:Uncharacterized protein n=1 Tax=Cardiocondyla obscurior TaxID=286306 RepID=A0AAW2GRR1_9HYME